MELDGTIILFRSELARIAEVNKEFVIGEGQADSSKVKTYAIGKGNLIWCSVPVELNERSEPLIALYRHAIAAAGVGEELRWQQGGDSLVFTDVS